MRKQHGHAAAALSDETQTRNLGAADMCREFRLRAYRGIEGMRKAERPWKEVMNRSADHRFYQTWDWYFAYLTSLCATPEEFFVVLLFQGTSPVAVIPLQRWSRKQWGVRVVELAVPEHPHLALRELLCASDISADMRWRYILGGIAQIVGVFDVFRIRKSPRASFLTRTNKLREDGALARSRGCSDYIAASDFESYLQGLSKNFRASLRKARNKLAAQPAVDFIKARSGDELWWAFKEFLAVESSGWKGCRGTRTAIALDKGLVNFYASLGKLFGGGNGIEINLLRVGERTIGGQICLRVGEVLSVLKIGYDELFKQFAPGNLLLEHVLREEFTKGMSRKIDLVSDANWHTSWKPDQQPLFELSWFTRTRRGVYLRFLDSARLMVSRIRQRSKQRRGRPNSPLHALADTEIRPRIDGRSLKEESLTRVIRKKKTRTGILIRTPD